MFIVYKFIIIITVLIVLSYALSVPYTYLFIVILVIIGCDSDFQEYCYNCIPNLKVKSVEKKSSSDDLQNYSTFFNSTPNMQNSRFNKYSCSFSPISKGNNGISRRLSNGITSTPIDSSVSSNSLFSPSRISTIRSPPRYSLSDVSSASPPNVTTKSPKLVQKVSGPLLASTRFNVNLGTYTDSKSPGLVNRIVQYDLETKEKYTSTHQAKYGSPGVFPIVHFFKKEIPVISPKPNKVTIRIASPDTSLYDSSRYSRNFANDKDNKTNDSIHEPEQPDISTRSVLDALKEISRKRINSSAEFESNQESCKRQKRNECINNNYDYNTQTLDEAPVQEVSSNESFKQHAPDKICVVDMIAASFSSSKLLKEHMERGLKRKAELESREEVKQKQLKLKNAETQTPDEEINKPKLVNQSVDYTSNILAKSFDRESEQHKPKEQVSYRYNIFDDKKLEIHKKNKLATLLSAITGEKPVLIPYEKPEKNEKSQLESKLVSIISPQNKPKHDKHVTFNLPVENTKGTFEVSDVNAKSLETQDTNSIVTTSDQNNTNDILETTKNVSSPLASINFNSNNVTESNFNGTNSNSTNFIITSESATPITSSLTNTTETSVTTGSSIKYPDKIDQSTVSFNGSSVATTTTNSSQSAVQEYSFGIKPNVSSSQFKSPSPSKKGGFKFDFGKGMSTIQDLTKEKSNANNVTSMALIPNTNVSSPTSKSSFAPIPNTNDVSKLIGTPPSFNFGSNSDKHTVFSTSNNSSIAPVIPSGVSVLTSIPTFGVTTPSSLTENIVDSPVSSKTSNTVSALNPISITSPTSTFGTVNTFGTASVPAFGTGTVPAFGITNSFTPTSGFGSPSGFNTNNSTVSTTFGTNGFGTTTTVPLVSTGSSVTPAFGNTVPTFGNVVTTSTIPDFSTGSKTPSVFGAATTAPSFGSNTMSSSVFGTSTTASSVFGASTTQSSVFGASTTASSVFGTGTTASSVFGTGTTASSVFGTNTKTYLPPFLATVTTSTPIFGVTTASAPLFGNNISKSVTGFVSTAAPLFGSNTTTTSTFGTNPAPTLGFGNNTSAFGPNNEISAPNFSANMNKTNLYVSNANATVNTTTSVSTFGTKGFNFGSNSALNVPAFGDNRTNAPFNFSSSSTSAPVCSVSVATPAFGSTFQSTSNQMPFGTTQSLNTPISSANIFGSSTSAFGSGPSTFGTKNDAFNANTAFNYNFGNSQLNGSNRFGNAPASNQTLGFGTGDNATFPKPQAPSNVFGSPGSGDPSIQFRSNVPAAINSSQPTFGLSKPTSMPAASQSGVFSFGSGNQPAPGPTAGVFSFGSNEMPKTNFNFSSGSNTVPAFGTSPTLTQPPNFNATSSQFGTPVAGMFSIGSGSSTTNRPRTQLKAKRRG